MVFVGTSKIRAMAFGKRAQFVRRSAATWPLEAASATEGRVGFTPGKSRRGREGRTCSCNRASQRWPLWESQILLKPVHHKVR